MHQCSTAAEPPQALLKPAFPVVSYRLALRAEMRQLAQRVNIPVVVVDDAVDRTYRETRGDRFATRRAGWHVIDSAVEARGIA